MEFRKKSNMQKEIRAPSNRPPPFSESSHRIQLGATYKHYKGELYKVLSIARHSETLQELVVYQALYGEKDTWARPVSMFLEQLLIDGKEIQRFTPIIINNV